MTTSRMLARRPGGRPRERAGTVSELGLEAGEEMWGRMWATRSRAVRGPQGGRLISAGSSLCSRDTWVEGSSAR